MKPTLPESKISLTHIHESILPQIPPWIVTKPNVIPKTKTHPSTYLEKFRNILKHHPDYLYVFTDGSKDNDKTMCTTVLNKKNSKKKLFLWKTPSFQLKPIQ